MTRLISDHWWRAHERYLRYGSHASAAFQAAHNKFTPPSLVRGLLERHARFQLMAEEARKEARRYEE